MLRVTTSWDDGDILDKRLADLLLRYGIKGTFYISKDYRPEHLSDQEILDLAKAYEVGAHTLTHPDLRTLTPAEKKNEINGSKKWLEELLGAEIKMFCYPKGLYDDSVVSAVKEAGFLGARTTQLGAITSSDPFLMPTTIQIYPFPFRKDLGKFLQPYKQRAPALKTLGVSYFSMYSWFNMSKAVFDIALEKGETFHLWGHSWEIEKYGMWEELEKIFQYIGNRKDCVYLTNSESIK
ncbi:MAG: polysaccharide deacetylase family protein [bacterium]|nr:polysaccharide deacetylase family protein [bacterium]